MSAPSGAEAEAEPPAVARAQPNLPDAICVHCGQRFNSAHLAYGVVTSKLPEEVRAHAARAAAPRSAAVDAVRVLS
jgi:hypothetical protein